MNAYVKLINMGGLKFGIKTNFNKLSKTMKYNIKNLLFIFGEELVDKIKLLFIHSENVNSD